MGEISFIANPKSGDGELKHESQKSAVKKARRTGAGRGGLVAGRRVSVGVCCLFQWGLVPGS